MGVVLAALTVKQLDATFDFSKTLGAMAMSNVTSNIAYVVLLQFRSTLSGAARVPRKANA